jgi:hypothetical protein
VELFLQLSAAIKRTGGQYVLRIAFNETFVSLDCALSVTFFFGSFPDLKQLRSIAAYFFFAGRYVLRFLSRLENDRGLAGFGQKKRGNRKN